MSWAEQALGVAGVLATLFGVALVVAPDLVHTGPVERLTAAVAASEPTDIMLVLGIGTALVVAVAAWPRSSRQADPRFDKRVERWAGGDSTTTDDTLGVAVETAIREGGEPWQRLQAALADTAGETYAREAGVTDAEAAAAVRRGAWTDDGLAAAVTGDRRPPAARLRLWLAPVRERRRRVERTVTAIEGLEAR